MSSLDHNDYRFTVRIFVLYCSVHTVVRIQYFRIFNETEAYEYLLEVCQALVLAGASAHFCEWLLITSIKLWAAVAHTHICAG